MKSKYSNINEILDEATLIHNNKYTYDIDNCILTIPINTTLSFLKIICPIHGTFSQTIRHHLSKKQGCKKCGHKTMGNKRNRGQEKFIAEANLKHANLYSYDKTSYINCKQLITVTCKKHGDFLISPDKHLSGNGCKKCKYIKMSNTRTRPLDSLIENAHKLHNNKYSYEKVIIRNLKESIEILCPVHGSFFISWRQHLINGIGCNKCNNHCSNGEQLIAEQLNKHNITYNKEKIFDTLINPKTNRHLRFDFFLPSLNYAIEFQGAHHYKENCYSSHQTETLNKVTYRDNLKITWCKQNNIGLLIISMYDTAKIPELIDQLIKK